MCKAVENYAKEYAIEIAVKNVKMMMDDGVNLDKALKYANIDRQTYEKYFAKLQ